MATTTTHGGARAGAGRKKLKSPTYRSLSTIVPVALADRIAQAAAEKELSVSMLIREILEKWEENDGK